MLFILFTQLPSDKRGLYIGPYGLQYKLMMIKKKKPSFVDYTIAKTVLYLAEKDPFISGLKSSA